MKYVLALFVLIFIGYSTVLSSSTVSAHQSGCHRWHSCPSDSGSYVCGDLGYTSGCGGSTTYIAPIINYTSQGLTGGRSHAERDVDTIKVFAQTSGAASGTQDGSVGGMNSPEPNPDMMCIKTFTFDTPQDANYVSGYSTGYKDACESTYEAAYIASYTPAYRTALASYQDEEQRKKDAESAKWTWIVLGGLGLWGAGAAIKGGIDNRRS